MPSQHFQNAVVPQVAAVRRDDQTYLKWIEENAKTQGIAMSLHVSLNRQLEGYTGDLSKPEHTDSPKIYLAKAALAFLSDCLSYHADKGTGFDPEKGFSTWRFSAGRCWLINDENNVLNEALSKLTSKSVAELEASGRSVPETHEVVSLAGGPPIP